jgi:hypothetical protein
VTDCIDSTSSQIIEQNTFAIQEDYCVNEMREDVRRDHLETSALLDSLKKWSGTTGSSDKHQATEGVAEFLPSEEMKELAPSKRIVCVTWVDSCSRAGWTQSEAAKLWAENSLTVRSVGFLFKETKNTISIVQSYDDNKDPNPNGLLQIPRCSVTSVDTIAE